MSIFEDTGFDMLPKIPVPGNTPVTIHAVEQISISPTAISTIVEATKDPTPPKKGGSGYSRLFFGLILIGTIGVIIYIANKDSAPKKSTEN